MGKKGRLPYTRPRPGTGWRGTLLRPRWILGAAAGLWLLFFSLSGRGGAGPALDSRKLAEKLSGRPSAGFLACVSSPASRRLGYCCALCKPDTQRERG